MLNRIDVLKQQLQTPHTSQAQLEILHELAWNYFLRNDAENLEPTLSEAHSKLNTAAIAEEHYGHHEILSAYLKAISVSYVDALEQALSTERKWADSMTGVWRWRMQSLLGLIHSRIGNSDDAMQAYRSTYDIALAQDDSIGKYIGTAGIGFVYAYIKDYDNALHNFLESLEIANHIQQPDLKFRANFNLCQIYIYLNELDKAEHAALETIVIARSTKDDKALALATTRIVHVHIERQQYEQAESLLQASLNTLDDSRKMKFPHANLMYLLGKVYNAQQRYTEALEPLSATIEWAKSTGDSRIMLDTFEHLITAYEQAGNFQEALRCQKEYFDLYRKFNDERNVEKIKMLEILHRTREAETQLDYQKHVADEAVKRAQQTQQYFEELNSIKNEFIDSATHDLKNPLTGIRLNADLLRRKIDTHYHSYLDRIEQDTQRMNRLISEMLDVAKIETGNALNFSLDSIEHLIDELLASHLTVANQSHIHITTQYPEIPVNFYFDANYLYRCLSNLLSNAIKYSLEGKQVIVTVTTSDKWVHIAIADEGIGIPEKDLPRIFERFYRVEHETTAKIEGTGLGLSIVKSIVEQHKGTISVSSQIGQGTTFTIALPYIKYHASLSSRT